MIYILTLYNYVYLNIDNLLKYISPTHCVGPIYSGENDKMIWVMIQYYLSINFIQLRISKYW